MKAAVIREHGGYDKILFEERPVPVPSQGQYLIKVQACGLNHLDTWVRRGVPGHKFPLPLVPGCDIAGTIEKASFPAKLKEGDRVIINPAIFCGQCPACQSGNDHLCVRWGLRGETVDGGCQEYVIGDDTVTHRIPDALEFDEAACIPIAYVTAWEMLLSKAKIKRGETILIHAAGSGVSVASLQVAKAHGLQIIVTSSTDEKLAEAKKLGAHHLINSMQVSFREEVKRITGKLGVDVVVDHVGSPTMMDSIRSLKKGGRLVSCGATGGAMIEIDWKHVFFKNIALLGSTYGPKSVFNDVLGAFGKGELKAIIDTVLPLERLPEAHEALEDRRVFGKIVVGF